jgi:hypothetical protein
VRKVYDVSPVVLDGFFDIKEGLNPQYENYERNRLRITYTGTPRKFSAYGNLTSSDEKAIEKYR